jgi:ACR3 family arsenite efflux pump ArsB
MRILSRLQPVWIIVAAFAGILAGQVGFIAEHSARFIEIFLMVLLFVVFSCVDIRDITKSFANFKFSATALMINFVWTPVLAMLLGRLFLSSSADLQVGFLMLMVTPCTDWYLIFTGLARGNVPLGASILPMNLILQILLLPLYLWLFMGDAVAFVPMQMLMSVILVLVVPLASANLIKWMCAKVGHSDTFASFMQRAGDHLQLVFLCLAVMAMFASQGRLMFNNLALFVWLFVPLILFFAVNFALALLVGSCLKMPFPDRISLLFTTAARNSPVSLAIATIAFPDQPLISLALIIGPLIELPILGIEASLVRRIGSRSSTGN